MRFDDMLATVLAQAGDSPSARVALWRQLVDLAAQRRLADEIRDEVHGRIIALRAAVPLDVRRATARAVARSSVPASVVALFAQDVPAVAAPLLASARLPAGDWVTLLPRLSPTARALLRHRRDLPAPVRTALDSFGASDLVLGASPEAVAAGAEEAAEALIAATPPLPEPMPAAPVSTGQGVPAGTGAPPTGGSDQIRQLVARIESFRRERKSPFAAAFAPPAEAVNDSGTFRFESDADGMLTWVAGVERGPLIGMSLSQFGEGDHGVDGYAAGACRRRAPFRDARLSVGGQGPAAGEWRISAVPFFDPQDGRFLGYRGTGRRPRPDERAGPRAAPGLFGSGLPADSLRQLVHELRTPLNAIAGFAEMIDRQMLGPAADGYRARAQDIVAQAQRLLAAIEDLDVAARLDTQRLSLERETIACGAITGRLRPLIAPLADARGVALRCELPEGLPPLAGDEAAVERMIARLAGAVVALAVAGETVTIGASAPDAEGRLVLAVSRPAALAEVEEAMLLDPGYGPDGDWPDAPALGLGFALRLVRNLAAANQGRFDIDADAFRLRLALAATAEPAEESA